MAGRKEKKNYILLNYLKKKDNSTELNEAGKIINIYWMV